MTVAVVVELPTAIVPVPALVMVAVFDNGPLGALDASLTVMSRVLCPVGMSTAAQVTVPGVPPLCEQPAVKPPVPLKLWNVVFAGNGSLIVAFSAVLDPPLFTVM